MVISLYDKRKKTQKKWGFCLFHRSVSFKRKYPSVSYCLFPSGYVLGHFFFFLQTTTKILEMVSNKNQCDLLCSLKRLFLKFLSSEYLGVWGKLLFYHHTRKKKNKDILDHHKIWETKFSSVQSLSHAWLFVTPWTAACQASLSITNSQSLLKLMSIELVMPSNHLILCGDQVTDPSFFWRGWSKEKDSYLTIWKLNNLSWIIWIKKRNWGEHFTLKLKDREKSEEILQ